MSFEVIGHRGAAGHAPENTAISFEVALAMQVDAVELDIHLSKDGRIVVMHDKTVDRTTNGTGTINDLTAQQLKTLDAGSWFDPSFAGIRIPFFEEVLAIVGRQKRIVIEIKERARTALLVDLLAELLVKHNVDVVISSFGTEALQLARERLPHIPRAWLMSPQRTSTDEALREAERLDVFQLCPRATEVDEAWVRKMHAAGYTVRAWGIPRNEPNNMGQTMRKLVQIGVNGATADYPDVLRTTVMVCQHVT